MKLNIVKIATMLYILNYSLRCRDWGKNSICFGYLILQLIINTSKKKKRVDWENWIEMVISLGY